MIKNKLSEFFPIKDVRLVRKMMRCTVPAQINNNTDRTIYVVFFKILGTSFTITWGRSQKELRKCCFELQDRQREWMRLAPLGLRLRDIVNEKLLNLEKTTKSVKSVLLLIYEWVVGETKINV